MNLLQDVLQTPKHFFETIEKEYPASVVYEDNAACLQIEKGKKAYRTKHIGLPYHWFRSKVSLLEIDIQVVSSVDQDSDQSPKGLCHEKV